MSFRPQPSKKARFFADRVISFSPEPIDKEELARKIDEEGFLSPDEPEDDDVRKGKEEKEGE
jgi:hypothetical protein